MPDEPELTDLGLPDGDGVVPDQHLHTLIDAGVIAAEASPIPSENVQPASLDLRLGPVAYRLRCSFLPDKYPVETRMSDLVMGEVDLRGDDGVLEKERPYLVPLQERLSLPPGMRAKANPKSSTGRADVFTRVISDRSYRFDEIADGYHGRLYLEVVPLSFAVKVSEGLSLNQLRLSVGRAALTDDELAAFHAETPILFADGEPVRADKLARADGLFLGLNLRGDHARRVGYKARANAPLLDLTKVRALDPASYWEPVVSDPGNRIILEPHEFYLLMSNEAVSIPPSLAAEMTAYDPTSGELRTHYAGFFDPGFGYDEHGEFRGSTAALEVRAHDVAFMIEHRQRVCKLTFERMLAEPSTLYGRGIGSNYQRQTETLGKHFVPVSTSQRKAARAPRVDEAQLDLLDQPSRSAG
jgi:dCTP deaminase